MNLSKAISAIGVILAAFGGSLIKAQPPGNNGQAAGFIGSFAALIILLIISGITRRRRIYNKIPWITIAISSLFLFILLSIHYSFYKNTYVVGFPLENPDYYITGDSLDEDGIRVKHYLDHEKIPINKVNIIEYGGGASNIQNLWTESSINNITNMLNTKYLLIMVFLSVAIFSITEGIFSSLNDNP